MTRKLLCTTAAVIAMGAAASAALAAVEVNIVSGNAPNVFGSSSWAPWWSNARHAVRNDLSTYGSGNAQFDMLSDNGGISSPRPAYEALATGFDSWQGVALGTGELGHRAHFVYSIRATGGESLSFANVSFIQIYENGWGDTDWPIFNPPASFDSSTGFDPDRRVGYAEDGTLVTSGTVEQWDSANPSNPIEQIIGTFGMAYAVYYGPGEYYYEPGDTHQDTLDRALDDIMANLQSWRGVLTYDGATVETTVQFIPEPASLSLLGLGGLALLRRRR